MTDELALLVSLIAVGAAWLLVHLMLLVRALRAPGLSRGLRALSLLPPATPVVGWLAGARVRSALWAGLGATYAMLRSMA